MNNFGKFARPLMYIGAFAILGSFSGCDMLPLAGDPSTRALCGAAVGGLVGLGVGFARKFA